MNRDEVVFKLQSYRRLLARIEGLQESIDEIEDMLTSLGNSIGDGMPHGTGDYEAKYTKQVNKLVDLQAEMLKEQERLYDVQKKTLELIYLAPTQRGRDILELRYRYGWKPKRISEKINTSDTNVRAIQNRAIDNIVIITEKARN